jgi:putative DNA primase/helicase
MAKKKARAWTTLLQFKKNGDAYGNLSNAIVCLSHDPSWEGVLAYDEFIGDIVTLRLPPWPAESRPKHFRIGVWTDQDSTRCADWLARTHEVRVDTRVVEEALRVVAEASSFHPVRAWLRQLSWDRTKRLDTLLIRLGGAEDSPYIREVTKNFLIGAVARVCRPGCQLDDMPILEGPQGVGKTTFLKALFGADLFLSTSFDITNKDGYQVLQRKLCAELGELDSLSKRQISAVKQYVSQATDTYRPSYGRRARDFPRQIVFAGTTNDSIYLRDPTGARRFRPIVVQGMPIKGLMRMDVEGVRLEREQLFAEAYARFRKGETWHIADPKLWAAAAAVAEEKRQADPWEFWIQQWIDKKLQTPGGRLYINAGITTSDVLTRAIGVERRHVTKGDEMRVAEALKLLGFGVHERVRGNAGRVRVYKKSGALELVRYTETEEVTHVRRKKPRVTGPGQPKNTF